LRWSSESTMFARDWVPSFKAVYALSLARVQPVSSSPSWPGSVTLSSSSRLWRLLRVCTWKCVYACVNVRVYALEHCVGHTTACCVLCGTHPSLLCFIWDTPQPAVICVGHTPVCCVLCGTHPSLLCFVWVTPQLLCFCVEPPQAAVFCVGRTPACCVLCGTHPTSHSHLGSLLGIRWLLPCFPSIMQAPALERWKSFPLPKVLGWGWLMADTFAPTLDRA